MAQTGFYYNCFSKKKGLSTSSKFWQNFFSLHAYDWWFQASVRLTTIPNWPKQKLGGKNGEKLCEKGCTVRPVYEEQNDWPYFRAYKFLSMLLSQEQHQAKNPLFNA